MHGMTTHYREDTAMSDWLEELEFVQEYAGRLAQGEWTRGW